MKLDNFDLKVINKALEIEEPRVSNNTSVIEHQESNIVHNKNLDLNYARENIYEAIEQGKDAMSELLEIAKQSEHPRAFEVFGQLLERVTKASSDLIKLQRTEAEIKKLNNSDKQNGPKSVTNAIFVGSTKELSELIKNTSNKQSEESNN